MRRFLVAILLLLTSTNANAGTLKWGDGWAGVKEVLNFSESYVSYDYFSASKFIRITYSFNGAKPKKLYQVGLHLYCSVPVRAFGQYATNTNSCVSYTLNGVTRKVDSVETGMILTDAYGNGTFEVNIGPIEKGTYYIQFSARTGAGCYMYGYSDPNPNCAVIFSAPASFGRYVRIIVN
jgi:hypothetical protein